MAGNGELDPSDGVPSPTDTEMAPREIFARRALIAIVLAVGLSLTAAAAWAAWAQNQDSTKNILRVQTSQAGEVLIASIPSVVSPLATGGELAANSLHSATVFRSYMNAFVRGGSGFTDASLWLLQARHQTAVTSIGARPDLVASAPTARRLGASAAPCAASFTVVQVEGHGLPRFGYACSIQSGVRRFVVYAERPLPASRRARVASNSAFSQLRYAIYLGPTVRSSALIATDFASLPPSGVTTQVSVPFGNTSLTLLTAPAGSLTGWLSDHLPWLIGVAGTLVTLLAALVTRSLVRRRQEAEFVSQETQSLNVEIGRLLAEQRTIAETLQRSLLPLSLPSVPGMEIEARYVPSSDNLEVGGDWYSVVQVDESHLGFVVGDVSGHGIQAAAVMAALRFTIRSLILEGHSPRDVLERCSAQVKDLLRGHFVTVLVGVVNLETRQLVMANAGHLNPLLVSDAGANFLETSVGVPIGVPQGTYELSTLTMPVGATLFAFTDGLVERRGEGLDEGLERLRGLTKSAPGELGDLLSRIVDESRVDREFEDDLALLALRWH